jgi:hypothetical protein
VILAPSISPHPVSVGTDCDDVARFSRTPPGHNVGVGMATASYRVSREGVEGVQAEISRHGVSSAVRSETSELAELITALTIEGTAQHADLSRLRMIVESVLLRREIPIDLASQAFDGNRGAPGSLSDEE